MTRRAWRAALLRLRGPVHRALEAFEQIATTIWKLAIGVLAGLMVAVGLACFVLWIVDAV